MAAGTDHGCRDMTGRLRRVLVRAPRASVDSWRAAGWRAEPDARALAAEHAAFCERLEEADTEVVFADPAPEGTLDDIYVFDPAFVCERGAVLLRPGKRSRRAEPASLDRALAQAGVPTAGRLAAGHAEGGDLARLDERTLLAGVGYRTDEAGVAGLAALLPGLEVRPFDLPHAHGPRRVLHLLSLLSPLDRDLAVAFVPLLPVRLVQLLAERGVRLVEVPEEELGTMGPNVLALGPRRALAPERNARTRRRLERAGVDVAVYRDDELRKGEGGPTCLTLPLLRE